MISVSNDDVVLFTKPSSNKLEVTLVRVDDPSTGWNELELNINNTIHKLKPSSSSICSYTIDRPVLDDDPLLTQQQLIPKTIVQTHETYSETNCTIALRGMNPEYNYIFFDSVQRRNFIKKHFYADVLLAYDTLVSGAFQADIFRYCYLYVEGGCYLDHKIVPRVPLREIINPEDTLLLCNDYEKTNSMLKTVGTAILNAIIFTTPKNSLFLSLINNCVAHILKKQDFFIWSSTYNSYNNVLDLTGPTLMYKVFNEHITPDNIRFKHIIVPPVNNTPKYSDFQIVDINTQRVLFSKLNTMDVSPTHYSISWGRQEIFYKPPVKRHNLLIFEYPHKYSDAFAYTINDREMTIKRTDKDESWWLDLHVKIVDNISSKSEIIRIGRNTVITPMILPTLPPCVYFAESFHPYMLNIPKNSHVVFHTPDSLKLHTRSCNEFIICGIISNDDVDDVVGAVDMDAVDAKNAVVGGLDADLILLYTCYKSRFIKNNNPDTHVIQAMLSLINRVNFETFKIMNSNNRIPQNLLSKFTKCLRFGMTDDVIESFTEGFYTIIKTDPILNTEHDYSANFYKYSYILDKIIDIIKQSGEPLEGNIFYNHDSKEIFDILPEFKPKRLNLFAMSKQAYNILEVGFNAGHSALLFLISNPSSKIQLFDLGEHSYSRECFNLLDKEFPNRLSIVWGDSTETLKAFTTCIKYDFIHIDGGHSVNVAESDFYNCKKFSDEHTISIIDDYNSDPTRSLCDGYERYGELTRVKLEHETDFQFCFKYKF